MGLCLGRQQRSKRAAAAAAAAAAATSSSTVVAVPPLPPLPPTRSSSSAVVIANAGGMSGSLAMANSLRNIVSKQRRRYTEDGFNLDLTYITDNLIAMGYPAEKLEGIYRNHIDDVARMLELKHKDHYKIYNLCSERSYDSCKFQQRVAVYPFNDHNPPQIELIQKFCEDVDKWLNADSQNVAAVHCKAGKGRTGTMICCYLLYCRKLRTPVEALEYYGQKRAHDQKGVTIPSQRRYVEYYAILLNMSASERTGSSPTSFCRPPSLHILELSMQPPPALNGGQGKLEFFVSAANCEPQKVAIISLSEVRRSPSSIRIRLDQCTPLVGDIKVEVYYDPKFAKLPKIIGKEKLFHFWFNTFFVTYNNVNSIKEPTTEKNGTTLPTYSLTFNKWELDDAHKDTQHKIYSPDFMMQLVMQCVPENSWSARPSAAIGDSGLAPSASSSSSAEEDSEGSLEPEEGWDSAVEGATGEAGALLGHYRLLSEPELDNIPNSASSPHAATSPPEVERMLHA